MKCPKCGKEITEGTVYCGYCGEKLESDPVEKDDTIVEEVPEAEKEVVIEHIKNQLQQIAEVLKNPFEPVESSIESTCIILAAACIALFGLCGNLLTAFIIETMLVMGLTAMLFVENTSAFAFQEALKQAAQIVLVPTIVLVVMDLLNWLCIPDIRDHANLVRAMPGLFIYIALGLFGIFTLFTTVAQRMKKVKGYGLVMALTFLTGMILIFFGFIFLSSLLV